MPTSRAQGRWVWIGLVAWSVAAVAWRGAADPFAALGRFLLLPLLILGAFAILGTAAAAWRGRPGPAVVARIAVLFSAMALIVGQGAPLARWARFCLARADLEHQVELISRGQPSRVPDSDIQRDPLRIAFPRGGILDHWQGYVFDPTGALARCLDADGRAQPPAADWFGGRMIRAVHLSGPWYYAWFT